MSRNELPLPRHYDTKKVEEVWRVKYEERAKDAREWTRLHSIEPAAKDKVKLALLAIDCQNTFCLPEFELFVGGRSGTGAIDDNRHLCEFIYRNLGLITQIFPTMDTHTAMQIFHSVFLVNDKGENPPPFSLISCDDIESGKWKVNPAIAHSVINGKYVWLEQYLIHYARKLSQSGKYQLTVWPYHAMLGGIGHALVSAVEEACFFHTIARSSQTGFETKGGNPLTENYSVLRPEVLDGVDGRPVAQKNARFIEKLLKFDVVAIAGQAKSHCVAWTIDDLLNEILAKDPVLARKVYLLEDCTSSVVVPGVIDYTDQADAAFKKFTGAGMHVVRSTDPVGTWPGVNM